MANNNEVAVLVVDDFDPIINQYLEHYPKLDERVDVDGDGNPRLIIVNDNSIPFVNAPAGVAYGEPGGECLDVHGYIVYIVAENELHNYRYQRVYEKRVAQETYSRNSRRAKTNRAELGIPKGVVIEQLWQDKRRKTSNILLVGVDTDNYDPLPTFDRIREVILHYRKERGIKNFVINMSFVLMPLVPYLETPEHLPYLIDRRPLLQSEAQEYRREVHNTIDAYRWRMTLEQVNNDFNQIAKIITDQSIEQEENSGDGSIVLEADLFDQDHWLHQCEEKDLPILGKSLFLKSVQAVKDEKIETTGLKLDSIVKARYTKRLTEPRNAMKMYGSMLFARFKTRRDKDYLDSINSLGDMFQQNVLSPLENKGLKIIGVGAAGNRRNEDYQAPFAPARWPSVIAVSADKDDDHDPQLDVAEYSQNGDIRLPGITHYNQSVALSVDQSTKILNYRSSECKGTSYAAPRFSVIAGRFLAIGGGTINEKPDLAGSDWKNDLPKEAVEGLGKKKVPNGSLEEVMENDNKEEWEEAVHNDDE